MPDIQTIDPMTAVQVSGDTPRPSDTVAASTVADTRPVDADGVPFDPKLHAVDWNREPKQTSDGRWWKKPGLGAQALAKEGIKPPEKKTAKPAKVEPVTADGAKTLPGGSTFTPPPANPGPTAGETGVADAVPAPAVELLTPDQCKATATAITDGAIGMARMARGEHWAAEAAERTQLIDCLSRLWALYNLPRLGPIVELMMLLVSFVLNGEKRREDMKKLWNWALGRKLPTTNAPETNAAR